MGSFVFRCSHDDRQEFVVFTIDADGETLKASPQDVRNVDSRDACATRLLIRNDWPNSLHLLSPIGADGLGTPIFAKDGSGSIREISQNDEVGAHESRLDLPTATGTHQELSRIDLRVGLDPSQIPLDLPAAQQNDTANSA